MDLKLTLKCISKCKLHSCAQFRHDTVVNCNVVGIVCVIFAKCGIQCEVCL